MMKRLFALPLAALLAASLTACPARADAGLVNIDLVDRDTGDTLPEYRAYSQWFVPGVPGHRYSVRLQNRSGERVLVVLSVDGINAVSGQTAHPSQGGYVLEPYATAEISGWRKSLDDVAQFVFTDLPDSYAARTGRPDNVGVVGIAVFRERVYRPAPPIYPPYAREESARAAGSPTAEAARDASAPMAKQQLGTGHGQREWAPVSQTTFQRASARPAQVTQLRYDDVASLAAMGVLRQPVVRDDRPQAFPGGFVPDPRW